MCIAPNAVRRELPAIPSTGPSTIASRRAATRAGAPRTRRALAGAVVLVAGLLAASPAAALTLALALDPAQSRLVPDTGSPVPLSGMLRVELGAAPPVAAPTTFDLVKVDVVADALAVGLDPDLTAPGLGVLRADGSFLVPTLFLTLDAGAGLVDLTLTDVEGTLVPGGACGAGPALCLESTFALDTLGPDGVVDVEVVAVAVPEPVPGGLLAGALAAAGLRAAGRGRRGQCRGGTPPTAEDAR